MKIEPEELPVEFMNRTNANLELLARLTRDDPVRFKEFHEVTNRVNSLLGLLVVPKENQLDAAVPKSKLVDVGGVSDWPGVTFKIEPERMTIRQFLRHLRNAVAHGSFYFHNDEGEIKAVTFVPRLQDGTSLWKVTFTVSEFEQFVRELVSELQGRRPKSRRHARIAPNDSAPS